MYSAKVIKHSFCHLGGPPLVTMEVEYPHAIHKDLMTHRAFSRSYQSFRAFPPEKVIERIRDDGFVPDAFRKREKGMGEGLSLSHVEEIKARRIWEAYTAHSVETARRLLELDVAKAQVNFALQDLTSIRGIITATDWDNFWGLRSRPDNVRPEVKKIARMMEEAFRESVPQSISENAWHMPYVSDDEIHDAYTEAEKTDPENHGWREIWERLKKVSAARCARISYLSHDGVRDPENDLRLADQLIADGHMSPFEHVARPWSLNERWLADALETTIYERAGTGYGVARQLRRQIRYTGNLREWYQMRKDLPFEANYLEASNAGS